MRVLAIIIVLLPVLLAALSSKSNTVPPVILWAWERPEDLTFIDPQQTGVAFLAKAITLRGDKTLVKPRLQPLRLAPNTRLVAVVRIETDRNEPPLLSSAQLDQIAHEISDLSASSAISVVQIDFDATLSQRNSYRELLRKVRHDLHGSTALSITALASWCAGDNWLNDLPIDEAVPMLFRMGVEQRKIQRRLESGQSFESPICQHSAGVSTDELVKAPSVERLYIFSPKPWSKDSFDSAMETYNK